MVSYFHVLRAKIEAIIFLSALLILFMAAGVRAADTTPPNIVHEPVRKAVVGQPIRIQAEITDDTRIREATLYCRMTGTKPYYPIPMRRSQATYSENIPSELVAEPGVDYYILAVDESGNRSTVPTIDPENSPFQIQVSAPAASSVPNIVVLSPEPGEVISIGDYVIAASFLDLEGDVDPATARITVDKRDVTTQANVSSTLLTYVPKEPLSEGVHEISVWVSDQAGHKAVPATWRFTVTAGKERLLRLRGNFLVGIRYDKPSIRRENTTLWDNQINIGATGDVGWLRLDGNVYLSSQETKFLTSEKLLAKQPINRYSLSARSRWLNLTLGDTNPYFSDLTMNGIFVRGINTQIDLGWGSLSFIKGFARKAIEQEETQTIVKTPVSIEDSLVVSPIEDTTYVHVERTIGTFKRNITAGRLNFNIAESFEIGLNMLQAVDDTTSIKVQEKDRQSYQPQQDYALSLTTRLMLNNKRTILSAEWGETVATTNTFSELKDTTLVDIPENVKKFIKINASTTTTLNVAEGSKNVVPRLYKIGLRTPLFFTNWKAELYRVPANYVSLGNVQQQTDIKGLKIDGRYRLLNDQMTGTLNYNSYKNNLDKSISFTTTTSSYGFGITFLPNVMTKYRPYIDLGYRDYTRGNDSPNDTTKTDNATQTFTVSFGSQLRIAGIQNSININTLNMSYRDNRKLNPTAGFDNNSLSLSLRSIFPFSLTATVSFSSTANKDRGDNVSTKVDVFNLNGAYDLLQSTLSINGGIGLISTSNGLEPGGSKEKEALDNKRTSFSIGTEYSWTETRSFSGGLRFTSFSDNVDSKKDYTEPVFEISYRQTF